MKKLLTILLISIVFIQTGCEKEKPEEKVNEQELAQNNYTENVKTKEKATLYKKNNNEYIEAGEISKNVELHLKQVEDKYYIIDNLDQEYYINYKDVEKIDSLTPIDQRYKKYIPFNQNIITKEKTSFYNANEELQYTINSSYNLPIIINDTDRYFVEFSNQLLYVKKEDVQNVVESQNTTETNTPGIPVLNYHFVYKTEECNQSICTSEKQFREHLEYIKNNNYFTPKMAELEAYMDGKVQLPKSVMITADDAWLAQNFIDLVDEYDLNATYFLVTSWINPDDLKSKNVEFHSHTHNMHNQGDCPTGQGGGIQCLSEERIQEDLKASSEKLHGSKVLCYPFYEYNDYSIEQLKKAGYTMAFAGEYDGGDYLARPYGKKYEIPRWVMVNYTTMKEFANYLNLGKG